MDAQLSLEKLSDTEKDNLLKEILGKDYDSAKENLPILKEAIDVVSHIDNVLSLAELIPVMNTVLSGSRILSLISAGASVFSIFMFPVATMISITEAYQVGHRMYAYRCIAYTLTAWAFGKPIPASSIKSLSNLRAGNLVARKTMINEYKQLWEKTSRTVLTNINFDLTSKNIPKEAMQIILRAASNNNEQKLCELLMKGFESKMSYITGLTWKSNYSIKYPN